MYSRSSMDTGKGTHKLDVKNEPTWLGCVWWEETDVSSEVSEG